MAEADLDVAIRNRKSATRNLIGGEEARRADGACRQGQGQHAKARLKLIAKHHVNATATRSAQTRRKRRWIRAGDEKALAEVPAKPARKKEA
jgi:hypothetical protein